MRDLVIIGGGGHARVICSIIKKLPEYRIIGYTDRQDRGKLSGYGYLGQDKVLTQIIDAKPQTCAVIGVGMLDIESAQKRKNIMEYVDSLGFELPHIISPYAVVSEGVSIGNGTVIMNGVIINPGSSIGRGVILNTSCSIDHDCQIGDFSHIAPGATLSGGVKVGENVFCGAGAVIAHYNNIADNSIIGAGSTVIESIIETGTYCGSPAKKTS